VEDILNITQMDAIVIHLLRKHGWYEERNYDISAWLQTLSHDGHESFDYAEQILRSLGGININVCGTKLHKCAQFDFNAMCASGGLRWLKKLESIAKEPLFPLGEVMQGFAFVGRSKQIYVGDSLEFYWYGSSIEDYLNNLFDRYAAPKLLHSKPRSEESKKELEALFEKAKEQVRLQYPHLNIK